MLSRQKLLRTIGEERTAVITEGILGVLVDSINQLLEDESSLQTTMQLAITDEYHYSSLSQLTAQQRTSLAGLIEQSHADGFILPRSNTSFSVIPIRGPLGAILQKATKGVCWEEASSTVGSKDLTRLCALGILGVKLPHGTLGGPAAQLLIAMRHSGIAPHERTTDPLSAAAITYAARLPITNPFALMSRLYSFNSGLPCHNQLLSDAVRFVAHFAERSVGDLFVARAQSAASAGWHMFSPVHNPPRSPYTPRNVKLYISPILEDLPRCLSLLLDILPSVAFRAWKVGRFSYGITRSDKICIYFGSLEEGQAGAQALTSGLDGIRAQGVPFTQRQDAAGLVSMGFDPPRQEIPAHLSMQNSWRLWVARKIATAVIAAKRTPAYPLSPEQACLWALHFLGVEPETWTAYDLDFWRN